MKTRYPNVYQDKNGKYFYQIFIGTDANGKKKLKKGRRDALKHPFSSAYQAYKEAQRVQALYANVSADNISYASFMKDRYLPKYRGDVEASTYDTHNLMMLKGVDFLGEIKLKDIKVIDCEKYRTWLLTDSGFSRNYASLIYTAFRQSLDYAVEIGLIASNPSLKTKSIPKGRNIENYWTMPEFEKVLASINTDTFYEELIYVTFLFYYRIGCRVNEEFALRCQILI
ncbi:MAG: phage integrase SAM-like domain-containing protein [Lactobacillus iners]|nr:phage integrase SAM-like domain-containing protein [Lactobacillus iners]MCT7765731.1 phage integrase SAM-like domain-containing protein [Lactobacillus iners]MCT7767473.1 phage integrase SAM-like domain-containing protein [Lactobacillus iners]MCT7780216.1 phage integrase SAM-like domain-containing protein [Lactobacillus iners]MCT7782030.1 phage integrase SAM-like domain-containing protein [Lactobacillus iners]